MAKQRNVGTQFDFGETNNVATGIRTINLEHPIIYAHNNKAQVTCILFGLKYRSILDRFDYSNMSIIHAADISSTYATEIGKGRRLASLIDKRFAGMAFWTPEMAVLNRGTEKREKPVTSPDYLQYLTTIRTKPFLLLAGISGTGKSRFSGNSRSSPARNIFGIKTGRRPAITA